MQACLTEANTVMRTDLPHKIENTKLSRSNPLLPLFEAVVNSLQAIEDAKPGKHYIRIGVDREISSQKLLDGGYAEGAVQSFSIKDTGIGFTPKNLHSFFTADSSLKKPRGGKGLGRFVWLKAFDHAEIESCYEDSAVVERKFVFSENTPDEPSEVPKVCAAPRVPGTTVRLVGLKPEYQKTCPVRLDVIGQRLIEHCLPYFLDLKCPAITIGDGTQELNLNEIFKDVFRPEESRQEFTVGEYKFALIGLRVYRRHELKHRLIYAADNRAVKYDILERFVPNLQGRLFDENSQPFSYLGFVEGDYFDQNTDSVRTGFTFANDGDSSDLSGEVTLKDIRDGAVELVKHDLAPLFAGLTSSKKTAIIEHIKESPRYRILLPHVDEFVDQIPPAAVGLPLEIALHEEYYARERRLKQATHAFVEDAKKQSLTPKDYEARLKTVVDEANDFGKSALAEYVMHRKIMLDFLDESLARIPGTRKYSLEQVIHRIIYPMRTTSDEVPYEKQNLWIIDERLAYHSLLASDKPLKEIPHSTVESADRADILIFDRAISFGEVGYGDEALNSVMIIEFKQPDRHKYSEDPVEQVYRLVDDLGTGRFKDIAGKEIKVKPDVRAYAYVICDITKEVQRIAKDRNMLPTPDGLGWYVFNQARRTYVEIIPYAKLLGDAKRRNRVLFDKLNLP